MSAEATIPDAVIPAEARNQFDAPSRRHSRESGNPLSFARYPKYKDSGVEWLGEVPDEWSTVRLKQACSVAPSNVDKKTYDGQLAVRLCNYTYVYYNDEITDQIEFMAATATDDQVAKFSLKANDVLVTKDSETPDDIAVPAYVPKDLNGVVCGYHLALLRPLANCSGEYLKYLFHSRYLRSTFAVAANGLTRYGLSQYALDNAVVPFPPRHEQKAIAAFLDRETTKIDALIAEQEKLIALLKEKRQALISHAVTKGLDPSAPMKDSGIEWLGQVPAHWEVCQMRRFLACKLTNGIFKRKEEFGDGTLLINVFDAYRPDFKVDFITLDRVRCDANEQSVYAVEDGDVLFVRSSLKVEGIAVAVLVERPPEKAVFECHLIKARLRVERVLPRFASFLFSSSRYRDRLVSLAKVTTMTTIEQESLASLPIVLPPLIEQVEIAAKLDQEVGTFDMLAESAQHTIELLKERRAALISAAVTGKIDVRDKAASNKQGEARAVAGLMSHGA